MLKSSALSGEIGTLSLEKGAIIRRELFGQVPKGRIEEFERWTKKFLKSEEFKK